MEWSPGSGTGNGAQGRAGAASAVQPATTAARTWPGRDNARGNAAKNFVGKHCIKLSREGRRAAGSDHGCNL